MHKTVVINTVALTPSLIGEHTPFLKQWMADKNMLLIEPPLPAVTCTVQSCYLTGKWPSEHGIVGNGWYFKDECEIKFWRQSNKLVQAPKIWDVAKEINPAFTCANICWWYNMYSSADISVTPRPLYLADGRKLPDCYTHPPELRIAIQKKFGTFPLFHYWGPKTSIESSRWIANVSIEVEKLYSPTLTLIYLPHLDYNLQRIGPDHPSIANDLREIDEVCKDLISFYEYQGAKVLLLSEYGITAVHRPIAINKELRKNGLIHVREELGRELLDPGASRAFAVSDHQVAHVYINDQGNYKKIRNIVENIKGVESVYGKSEQKKHHINHRRSGDLFLLADSDSWFTYPYWLDDRKCPDFARTVDIHRKPGYDPLELFVDPSLPMAQLQILWKIARKKIGLRSLLDVIPLDASLVKGSHGLSPSSQGNSPVLIGKNLKAVDRKKISSVEVFNIIINELTEKQVKHSVA